MYDSLSKKCNINIQDILVIEEDIHALDSVIAVIKHSDIDMSEIVDLELDGVADLRMSPEAEQERGGAPPPRRKSFSKLRRRLSQTFRFSFNGSLSEFSHSFAVNEDRDRSNGEFANLNPSSKDQLLC